MNAQEIDLLLPQVTIDEIIEAAHKFADAWNTLGITLTEAVRMMTNILAGPFSYPEEKKKEEPRRDIQTSKPRFPRCSRRMSTHYRYIPTAPRNLPYMRRAY